MKTVSLKTVQMWTSSFPAEPRPPVDVTLAPQPRRIPMKGIIAWLLGVPVLVIILLYVFNIF